MNVKVVPAISFLNLRNIFFQWQHPLAACLGVSFVKCNNEITFPMSKVSIKNRNDVHFEMFFARFPWKYVLWDGFVMMLGKTVWENAQTVPKLEGNHHLAPWRNHHAKKPKGFIPAWHLAFRATRIEWHTSNGPTQTYPNALGSIIGLCCSCPKQQRQRKKHWNPVIIRTARKHKHVQNSQN